MQLNGLYRRLEETSQTFTLSIKIIGVMWSNRMTGTKGYRKPSATEWWSEIVEDKNDNAFKSKVSYTCVLCSKFIRVGKSHAHKRDDNKDESK